MLLTPDGKTYDELREFAEMHESYDGADQGLLNAFFGDGTIGHPSTRLLTNEVTTAKDSSLVNREMVRSPPSAHNWYRLSFTYNMEIHKVYRLHIPAVRRYQDDHKVLHFIGRDKPWHFIGGKVDMPNDATPYFVFYAEMVDRWWRVRRSLGEI